MNGQPTVSVVIPTRNRCHLLAATLPTVLAQRGVDLDVIVVDDGSTDGTVEYLEALQEPRITVVSHRRSTGVAAARNDGLDRADAHWVAFTDDDDLWAPFKVSIQLSALTAQPRCRWSCSGAVVVDERMRIIGQQLPHFDHDVAGALLASNVIAGGASGVVAETQLVREVGGFDRDFRIMADWDLWIRLALSSPVAVVNRPLHAYRTHAQCISVTSEHTADELTRIEDKYSRQRAEHGVALNRAEVTLWMADRHQRAGRRMTAASCFLGTVPRLSRSRSVARAAEAIALPRFISVHDWRNGRAVTGAGRAEVESWLGEVTTAPGRFERSRGAAAATGDAAAG